MVSDSRFHSVRVQSLEQAPAGDEDSVSSKWTQHWDLISLGDPAAIKERGTKAGVAIDLQKVRSNSASIVSLPSALGGTNFFPNRH